MKILPINIPTFSELLSLTNRIKYAIIFEN